MTSRGPIQTPFDDAVAPTETGAPSGPGITGGFDLGDGSEKETPNAMSGLPNRIDTFNIGDGSSDAQVPTPPVASPGTFHPGKP